MESTTRLSEILSQAFSPDKVDIVTIPKQQLWNILAENANVKIKLKAMDNLQHLLSETIRRLNEAETSLSEYKVLYKRSMQRIDRQLRLLCEVDASKTNKLRGLKSQPSKRSYEYPVLDIGLRTEGSSHTDDLITESEIERTLERCGSYDSMEFYIRDIDTLNPEIVTLPYRTEWCVEKDHSSMRGASDYYDGLVEYIVEEDGCLKSLDATKNTDIEDDREAKHKEGDSEHGDVFGTEANESSGEQDGKRNFQTSQGKPGDVPESYPCETALNVSSILVKSPDSVHLLGDSDIHGVPSVQRNKGEMRREHINESDSELERVEPGNELRGRELDIHRKQKETDEEIQRKHPEEIQRKHPEEIQRKHPEEIQRKHPEEIQRKHPEEIKRKHPEEIQRKHPEEIQRKHPEESDLLLLSNIQKSTEIAIVSNNPNIQTTNACSCCTNAERVTWLTKQNTRLKKLVRSILDRVSLTPASFMKLQEYEDTVVQLRQRISDLERRLTHLRSTPGPSRKGGGSSENVEQQQSADDATNKVSRLEKSVYIKQILIDALYRRIQQLNQDYHHRHHPPQQQQQQQQQQQRLENTEHIAQTFSISTSGYRPKLSNYSSGKFVKTGSKGTSTVQSTCPIPKTKDIPGTLTVEDTCCDPRAKDILATSKAYDTCYDPRAKDIPGTMTVQDTCSTTKTKDIPGTSKVHDTCYDPKSKDTPGTSTVQATCSDPGARSQTSRSPVADTKTRQGTREDSKELYRKISQPMMTHESLLKHPSDCTAHNEETKSMRGQFQESSGRFRTVSEEPTLGMRAESRREEIGYAGQNEAVAEHPLLSPGLKEWIGSRIYGAPVVDLVGEEKSEEELISIHSFDVFVCPRCEREFDTAEERRYIDHCQKCLDFG